MGVADRRVGVKGSSHTRALVSFHSDDGFDGPLDHEHPKIGQVIGVKTSKHFGAAAGTFEITVKKPPVLNGRANTASLLSLWRDPEDTWVSIKWVVDGNVIDGMFGCVDSVQESTVRGEGGARTETYVISGRDFGKVFETTQIFVNPYSGEAPMAISAYLNALDLFGGLLAGGPPDVFIRALLELWVGNSGLSEAPWQLPQSLGGGSFYRILNTDTVQKMSDGNGVHQDPKFIHPDDLETIGLWDCLQEYSNPLLNELWCDLAPPPGDTKDLEHMTPAIYLRERMFPTRASRGRWQRLRQRVLRPEDVRNRNVAKGGAVQRYNFWTLNYDVFGFQDKAEAQIGRGPTRFQPGDHPIVNERSIRKHGVRKWEQSTPFLPLYDPETKQNYLDLTCNWLQRCHDWYAPGPMQLSGQIVTARLFPEIRIGEKLREVRRGERDFLYYVEGVDHEWQYPSAGSTSLTVTRGEREDQDLLADVYKDYESSAARLPSGVALDGDLHGPPDSLGLDQFIVEEGLEGGGNSLDGAVAAATAGLLSEGAPASPAEVAGLIIGSAIPDSAMLPMPGDLESSYADLVAQGIAPQTIPPASPAPTEFDQAALERDDPIPTGDLLEGIPLEGDDPLEGIL